MPVIDGGFDVTTPGGLSVPYGVHWLTVTDLASTIWDFTLEGIQLTITTQSPGGDGECTWRVEQFDGQTPSGLSSYFPPLGSTVRVYDPIGIYWIGRLEEVESDIRPDGKSISYIARGFGSSAGDRVFLSTQVFTAGTTVLSAITTTLSLCPKISTSAELVTANRSLLIDSPDFQGRTAQEAINQLVALGSSTQAPLIWGVIPYNGNPTLELMQRPLAATYFTTLSECQVSPVAWPLQYVKNRISIRWADGNGAGGVATAQDLTSVTDLQSTLRDHYVDAQGQIGSDGEARMVAGQLLSQLKKIRPFGRQITLAFPAKVTDASSNDLPLWRIRAGRAIELTDLDSGSANFPSGPLFIRETRWDENNRTLILDTEEIMSLAQIVGRVIKSEAATPDDKTLDETEGLGDGGLGSDEMTDSNFTAGAIAPQRENPQSLKKDISINFVMNGGGSPLTTGVKGFMGLDFDFVLTRAMLLVWDNEVASTCSVTVETSTKSTFPARSGPLGFALAVTNGHVQEYDFTSTTNVEPTKLTKDDIIIYSIGAGATSRIATLWLRGWTIIDNAPAAGSSQTTLSISDLYAGGSGGTAIVHWVTDKYADSQVEYWTDSALPTAKTAISDLSGTKTHNVTIKGLLSGTLYFYRVYSKDAYDHTATATGSFTV